MTEDFVEVGGFLSVTAADLACAQLALAGIKARVLDENSPFAATRGAIRLVVRASDAGRAREILESDGEEDQGDSE